MKNRQGGLQEVQRFWGRAATVALVAVIAVTLNYGLDAPRRRTLRAGGGACHVSAGRRRVAPGETSQLAGRQTRRRALPGRHGARGRAR